MIASVHLIFVTLKTTIQIHELSYYDNDIIKTNLFLKFYHIANAFVFCLSYNNPEVYNGNLLILLIFLLQPFSYVLAKKLLKFRID